ncbi:PDR/VanB family oxidoreductase [Nocardioides sp.]|uniref:PDR/VanB family oxidoreductase n=1 Tax=Nocardioides sp. TaxID=35761 RepID=UPI0039E70C4D
MTQTRRAEEYVGHQHPAYALARRPLEVVALERLTDRILHVVLADPAGKPLAGYEPGSHLVVDAGQGRRNAYSLTGDGLNPRSYEISVLRLPDGDGGSVWLHEKLTVGGLLDVEGPRSMFPPVHDQQHSLLVAGGIGVTPVLSHARALKRARRSATILYSYRPGHQAHLEDLLTLAGQEIRLVEATTADDTRAALDALLSEQPFGTHAYACGPPAMLEAYEEAARQAGWPAGRVHLERFVAPDLDPGDPFTVTVASTGQSLEIPSGVSLLDGLLQAGVRVNYLCKQGVCGECRIPVRTAKSLQHRDFVLTAAEREAAADLMACVSRGRDIEVGL